MRIQELEFFHPIALYGGGSDFAAVQLFTAQVFDEGQAASFARVRSAHAGFDAGYYYLVVRAQGVRNGQWWGSMVLLYAVDGDQPVTIVKKGTDRVKYFRSIGEFEAVLDFEEARNGQVAFERSRAETKNDTRGKDAR